MSIKVVFRPFSTWPRERTEGRKHSPFRVGYGDTLHLLGKEIAHLDGETVVIQLNLEASEIRLDGMPRSGSNPEHPGVILSFESKFGPLQYLCDDCRTWQHNLRAIAMTLEHLRLAERYGVATRGEQYKGWTALPAPAALTRDLAVEFVTEKSGISSGSIQEHFRAALLKVHPDKGGSNEDFLKLQKCREILGI